MFERTLQSTVTPPSVRASTQVGFRYVLMILSSSSTGSFVGSTTGAGALTTAGASGSTDRSSSPTFALVHEYLAPGGPIFHFDLHRLDRADQVAALGFEDYVASGQPCWVEWADRAGTLMPEDACEVRIEVGDDGARRVTFVGPHR